jgi:iron(III) transport system ATP-binding protein
VQRVDVLRSQVVASPASVVLSVRGITKTFPARPEPVMALRGVDLTVVAGSFTSILGASGCGKTTLLRMIAGFDRPDSGEIHLGNRILSTSGVHVSPERRNIGIVPQEGALFPHLSVAQNVGFGLGPWHLRSLSPRVRRARAERIAELLELVGLPDHGQRRPDELSGGQQQRVALARALAPNPQIVLLDEPFSALDAGLRSELREEVRELLHRVGATAILVTHDQEEALSLADHVAVMRDGRVVQADSPQGVYIAPEDPHIAAFIGEVVLLPGHFVDNPTIPSPCAECALGCIAVRFTGSASRTSEECMVMLRPEQIEIADRGVPARVMSTSFFGHDGIVRLRLGSDGTGAQVLVRIQRDELPSTGDVVAVRVAGDGPTGVAAPAFQIAS